MFRTMMTSKIHRATVTQADLHYVGSVTVDQDLLDAAGLLEGEQVHIVDIDNGSRLETYTIAGERGSGIISINGAAAHLVKPGHLVILIGYSMMNDDELKNYSPKVVFVDENNKQISLTDDPADVPADSGLKDPRKPEDGHTHAHPLQPLPDYNPDDMTAEELIELATKTHRPGLH